MKILIWSKQIELKDTGGPSGYLYNLRDYLKKNPSEEIDFYPVDFKPIEKKTPKSGWKLALRNFVKRIASPIRFYKYMRINYIAKVPLTEDDLKLIDKYDFVHVHYLSHIRQSFLNFNNGHTRVVLTTHNPEPLVDQLADEKGMAWSLKCIPGLRNFFIRKELEAYDVVDYVMFPVAEAIEPYINRSSLYSDKFKEIYRKVFYVPTALNTTDPCVENRGVLKEYDIPDKALRVCYVGRHNEVKGYDTIQELAKMVWKDNPNTYFIIGGKQEPMRGLNDYRWIELGWVHTHSLLNEVDCFLLPNKDTYFDLILLEVLRQGTPVILTRTGGNKWYENKGFDGMFFYENGDLNTAKKHIDTLQKKKSQNEISPLRKANYNQYKVRLSMEKYIASYLETLKNL